ncbi:MAG TPA: glutamyl-tRNA reductase [Deltaproteobacteria bacterium]|nr:glutamyl-tRNA reductase [Deltaproteobacteria bacterium]
MKEAYRIANEAGTVGPLLHRLFHKSFAVAKRVRTETGVGAATLSVAQAAVDMADVVFDDLSSHPVLLLGAGEMSELALRGFKARGVQDLWVANRTISRATEVATGLSAGVVPWDQRARFLAQVDVVLCSTGARSSVLTRDDVLAVRKARKGRPLLLIDISVPRNLDPGINDLSGVYMFDIDDLGQVVQVNQEARQREAARAEQIVEQEVSRFERMLSDVHLAPLLRALHRRMASDSAQEVERSLRVLTPILSKLDEAERSLVSNALTRMSTALGKRFLHHPMQRLKDLGNEGEGGQLAEIAELFGVGTVLVSVPDDNTEAHEPGYDPDGEAPASRDSMTVSSAIPAASGDEN